MNNTNINSPETVSETVPAVQKQSFRRIGVYTMGGSLIIIGVGILISMFNPNFDILLAAKLSPLILVALGIEILVSTVVFRGEKLKYDFWSGFICFLLILFSVGAAVIPALWKNYGPDRELTENRLSAELEDQIYSDLHGVPGVNRAFVHLHLNSAKELNTEMTLFDLNSSDHIYVDVSLKFPKDRGEFAEMVSTCLDKLLTEDIPYQRIDFFAESEAGRYEVGLSGKFDFDNSAAEIAEMTVYNSYFAEIDDTEITFTIEEPDDEAPEGEFAVIVPVETIPAE